MCERRGDVPASLGRCAIAGVVSQKRGDYRRARNRPEVMTPVGVPVLASAVLAHATAPTVLVQRSNNKQTKSRLRGGLRLGRKRQWWTPPTVSTIRLKSLTRR